MGRSLNLEEIGRLAGVSRSTVSRVVNGEANVSPEAKARVEEIIAETGYRPHAAARSLASRRTGVLGLVIPSAVETLFDDPYFGRLILGVTRSVNRVGLTLSLFLINEEADEAAISSRVVAPGLVDGVIVTATQMGDPFIGDLRTAGMPFVVVGRPDEAAGTSYVDADNRGGAVLGVRHLQEMGRSRIATVAAPSTTTAGADRLAGYLEAIDGAEPLVAEGDFSEATGRRAMEELLPSRPDAVFAASDRMAVGALRAIEDAGLRCPDDIALVSFDGILNEEQVTPRLTSVAQPVFETGEAAADLLLGLLDGSIDGHRQIVLPVELVVRESSGAALGAP